MIGTTNPSSGLGLRMLIESWPGLKVVGEADKQSDAKTLTARQKPDILLLDIDPERNGKELDLLPELLSVAGDARVIVLSGLRDAEIHHRAVSLGAVGLVHKEKAASELQKAIRKVHDGEVWLDRSLTAKVIANMSRSKSRKTVDPGMMKILALTEREREVATLLCDGLKNKEIGKKLFISETTVRHHLTSVFAKLEVSSRFELIIFLYKNKFVKPPI